jgi:hypothetical protein
VRQPFCPTLRDRKLILLLNRDFIVCIIMGYPAVALDGGGCLMLNHTPPRP